MKKLCDRTNDSNKKKRKHSKEFSEISFVYRNWQLTQAHKPVLSCLLFFHYSM